MAQALLVNIDIALGREVVDALDSAGFKVNVALWGALSPYEDWRLLLASRRLEKEGDRMRRYLAANAVIHAAGISVERAPTKMIFDMKDPFIKELRRLYAKSGDVEGMRLAGPFGARYLNDSYVYRIT